MFRELRSCRAHAVVLGETGILDEPLQESGQSAMKAGQASGQIAPLHLMVDDAARKHIRRGLSRCAGSVSKTAELPGISRKTLWEKMSDSKSLLDF